MENDKLTNEQKIHELQNEDLKFEQNLSKRKTNYERLYETFTVDHEIYEKIVMEKDRLCENVSNQKLELDLKTKNLESKKKDLEKLHYAKKSIENSVL